jgi:hypothetical protein
LGSPTEIERMRNSSIGGLNSQSRTEHLDQLLWLGWSQLLAANAETSSLVQSNAPQQMRLRLLPRHQLVQTEQLVQLVQLV